MNPQQNPPEIQGKSRSVFYLLVVGLLVLSIITFCILFWQEKSEVNKLRFQIREKDNQIAVMHKEIELSKTSPKKQTQETDGNSKRAVDVNTILNGLNQYMLDHNNIAPPQIGNIEKEISKSEIDLCALLAPQYIAELPVDPSVQSGIPIQYTTCPTDYKTGYNIVKNVDGKIIVSAPYAEHTMIISAVN